MNSFPGVPAPQGKFFEREPPRAGDSHQPKLGGAGPPLDRAAIARNRNGARDQRQAGVSIGRVLDRGERVGALGDKHERIGAAAFGAATHGRVGIGRANGLCQGTVRPINIDGRRQGRRLPQGEEQGEGGQRALPLALQAAPDPAR